jgi:hypothetical protein
VTAARVDDDARQRMRQTVLAEARRLAAASPQGSPAAQGLAELRSRVAGARARVRHGQSYGSTTSVQRLVGG